MDILKSIIVTILVIVGIFWIVRESTYDPDYILLEYQCSKLDTYEQVPDQAYEECNKRREK